MLWLFTCIFQIWIFPENTDFFEAGIEDSDRDAWNSAEAQRISETAAWPVSVKVKLHPDLLVSRLSYTLICKCQGQATSWSVSVKVNLHPDL